MVAADFVLTPGVIFSDNVAAGVGGAAGGMQGRRLGIAAGGVKVKEAQTSLLVADTLTGGRRRPAPCSTKGTCCGRRSTG